MRSFGGTGDMATKKQMPIEGECIKDILIILAKSDFPSPRLRDGFPSYVVRLNRKGAVEGGDVHFSNTVAARSAP